jgi:hypothetical protein
VKPRRITRTCVFFFRKNKTHFRLPRHFLADYQSTHSGRKDRIKLQLAKFLNQQCAEPFNSRHILADLRALEKMSTVQARAQDKVSLQERFGAQENISDLLLNRIHRKTLS